MFSGYGKLRTVSEAGLLPNLAQAVVGPSPGSAPPTQPQDGFSSTRFTDSFMMETGPRVTANASPNEAHWNLRNNQGPPGGGRPPTKATSWLSVHTHSLGCVCVLTDQRLLQGRKILTLRRTSPIAWSLQSSWSVTLCGNGSFWSIGVAHSSLWSLVGRSTPDLTLSHVPEPTQPQLGLPPQETRSLSRALKMHSCLEASRRKHSKSCSASLPQGPGVW